MSQDAYPDPVAKLLTYGSCLEMDYINWPNYPETLGFQESDIPDLIRMATDFSFWDLDGDDITGWAPIHAWRSLGQLHAEAAIKPLLQLFSLQDNEWMMEELPRVFALIGKNAIPDLAHYLTDSDYATWARISAAECLCRVGKTHPDQREHCIAPMAKLLEQFAENDPQLNSMVICDLIDLKAVETAPLIQQVFEADLVNEMVVGTWPSVQVDLGLKQEADFSPKDLKPKMPEEMQDFLKALTAFQTQTRKPQGFGAGTLTKAQKGKKKKK